MYDEMMAALLAVVLARGAHAGGGGRGKWGKWDVVREGVVEGAAGEAGKGAEPCFNLLEWKAFTRGHRGQVLLPAPPTPPLAAPPAAPATAASTAAALQPSCGLPGCLVESPALRCSRCKLQRYCCEAHQRAHYATHKGTCRAPAAPSSSSSSSGGAPSPEPPRISRCMFCGEEITLRSEEEAVEHMRVCPALQEQLASKDQFTIPQVLRDKGVRLPGQGP